MTGRGDISQEDSENVSEWEMFPRPDCVSALSRGQPVKNTPPLLTEPVMAGKIKIGCNMWESTGWKVMNLKMNLTKHVSKMNRKTSAFIEENKLRTVNSGLEADLKGLYRSLGEAVYSMWEKGSLDVEELTPRLMEIREKTGQIRANQDQISEIQKKGQEPAAPEPEEIKPEQAKAETPQPEAEKVKAEQVKVEVLQPEAEKAKAETPQPEAEKTKAAEPEDAASEPAQKTEEVGEWSALERIYCPNCGISYALTANYCRKCGRKLH